MDTYIKALETIRRYNCPQIDSDEEIITLYADDRPYAQVIHRADGSTAYNGCYAQAKVFNDLDRRNAADLYSEDYETQRLDLIKPNAKIKDIVELCMNGAISYADAREWCRENEASLGAFDRCLYGALRKPDEPIPAEPKEPWPYRLVAFINRILEILINSILEDFV